VNVPYDAFYMLPGKLRILIRPRAGDRC